MTDDPLTRQMASERRWSKTPGTLILNGVETRILKPPPPPITVAADDGTALLHIRVTEDGMLDVTGAEDRWTEGAARFVAEMRRLIAAEWESPQ
jgi:hypothetical protein